MKSIPRLCVAVVVLWIATVSCTTTHSQGRKRAVAGKEVFTAPAQERNRDRTVAPERASSAPEMAVLPEEATAAAPAASMLDQPCFDAVPPGLEKAVGNHFWEKRVLTVKFIPWTGNGGNVPVASRELQRAIRDIARQWSEHAKLTFDFNQSVNVADIRITVHPHMGHWSYVGKQCLNIADQTLPTMNIGVQPNHSASDLKRVVLHEFGHALGLLHEHKHPDNPIEWNTEVLYREYAGPPNYWDKAKVDHNIVGVYQKGQRATGADFDASAFDENSIMMYPVERHHTLNGYEVGWNRDLSAGDIAFISSKYP